MSIDTLELVLGFEEEFGIEIPDEDAERMTIVADVVNFVKEKLSGTSPDYCLTQRIFYKLRRALIDNYGLQRHMISRNTVLSNLISVKAIEEGWPYLQMFIELETPNFKRSYEFFGKEYDIEVLTIEEIVYRLIAINKGKLDPYIPSEKEIFTRVVDVTVRQLNVNRDDVQMHVSFTKDLGAD